MNQDKRPVSVEDLLRLKRAEQPAPEFWSQFDRELRAKQLAALVAKRPWWQRWPDALAKVRRYQLPLGATAVLAVTFLSVRNDAPDAPPADHQALTSSPPAAIAPVSSQSPVFAPEVTPPVELMPVAADAATEIASVETEEVGTVVAADTVRASELVSDASAPGELSRMIPLLGSASGSRETTSDITPSARYIAANLAAAQEQETIGVRLLGASHGFESRAMPARAVAVEPLQQMTPPSEFRRSRYLTAMVSTTTEGERPASKVASRISGEELYEQVHRFGTRRGGFNVKF